MQPSRPLCRGTPSHPDLTAELWRIEDMSHSLKTASLACWAILFAAAAAGADAKPLVGLIPKARTPIQMDGRLDEWDGAFVTPVHVGHPDFANRGGEFLFLWD